MKVALNSWVLASRFRYHGTYVYARNLVAQFKRIAKARPEIRFCLFTSPAVNDANSIEPGNGFELARTGLLAWDRLWKLGGASLAAARIQADLIFSPTPSTIPIGAVPVVCTIHDATPIVMPSHSKKVTFSLRSLVWWSAKLSRAIITVSECSKADLVNIYGLPESKVSVVYNGYDNAVFNDAAPNCEQLKLLLEKLGVTRPYLLHHGVIQPRKNLKRLIEAYRLMLSRNRNLELDLVLAGPCGWQYDDILAAAKDGGGRPGRVILAGALAAADLATLVKGASLAVVPSLYEGFCLPMVEAMACGTPTIAASTSCLPEVSGGVLRYFNPLEIEDMVACMQTALEDSGLRNELVRRGKQRAACFNWERCAAETLDVIERRACNGSD